jgi:hypothetical protein
VDVSFVNLENLEEMHVTTLEENVVKLFGGGSGMAAILMLLAA